MILNRYKNQKNIISDTNGVINIIEHQGTLRRTLNRFRKANLRIFIPKFVLRETKKIRGYSEFETIEKLHSCLPGKIRVLPNNQDVITTAKELEKAINAPI